MDSFAWRSFISTRRYQAKRLVMHIQEVSMHIGSPKVAISTAIPLDRAIPSVPGYEAGIRIVRQQVDSPRSNNGTRARASFPRLITMDHRPRPPRDDIQESISSPWQQTSHRAKIAVHVPNRLS